MNPYVKDPSKLAEELQSDRYEGYNETEVDKNALSLLKAKLSSTSRNIKVS